MAIAIEHSKTIYQVSELNQKVRSLLEQHFTHIWVSGELSNLSRPVSGHIYFSLKDPNGQIRCAMFRMSNRALNFTPEDGMQVVVRAKVSLYVERGDYQLIVEHMEETGDGALRREFELLKQKLAQQGLFAEEHKQAIPLLPKTVGIITSATGAAIRDILSTLKRRFPSIAVIVYPCEVQGKQAGKQIVSAIQAANQHNRCDVLLLARGGGSLEDLWPFNEEIVAHALFASQLPIVTGIGHEIDFTIADFVADLRAATPTAAAEAISPEQNAWLVHFDEFAQRLIKIIIKQYALLAKEVHHLRKRLRHPRQQLQEKMQTLDYLSQQLQRGYHHLLNQQTQQLQHLRTRLWQQQLQLPQRHETVQQLAMRRHHALKEYLNNQQQRLITLNRTLKAVSPLATLERGYAIVTDQQQHILHQAHQVSTGAAIDVHLHQGKLQCTVTHVDKE